MSNESQDGSSKVSISDRPDSFSAVGRAISFSSPGRWRRHRADGDAVQTHDGSSNKPDSFSADSVSRANNSSSPVR